MARLKNVTITLDEAVARWARLEAARENRSVSRFVGELLAQRMRHDEEYDAAMERYLSLRPRAISKGRRYPRREELHDRAGLRRQ
jgi:hypothetical protein